MGRDDKAPPAPCCALADTCLCYTTGNRMGGTLPLDAMVTISLSGVKRGLDMLMMDKLIYICWSLKPLPYRKFSRKFLHFNGPLLLSAGVPEIWVK